MGWGEWGDWSDVAPIITQAEPTAASFASYVIPSYAAIQQLYSIVAENVSNVKWYIGDAYKRLFKGEVVPSNGNGTFEFVENIVYDPYLDTVDEATGTITRTITAEVENVIDEVTEVIERTWTRIFCIIDPSQTIENTILSLTPNPLDMSFDFDRTLVFTAVFRTSVLYVEWFLDDCLVATAIDVSSTFWDASISSDIDINSLDDGVHIVRLRITTVTGERFEIQWRKWIFPLDYLTLVIGRNTSTLPPETPLQLGMEDYINPIEMTRSSALIYTEVEWNGSIGAYVWRFTLVGIGYAHDYIEPVSLYKGQRIRIIELSNFNYMEFAVQDTDLSYGTSHANWPITEVAATVLTAIDVFCLKVSELFTVGMKAIDFVSLMGGVAKSVLVALDFDDDIKTISSEHITPSSEIWHYAMFELKVAPNENLTGPIKVSINDMSSIGTASIIDYGPEVEFEITLPVIEQSPSDMTSADRILHGIKLTDGRWTIQQNNQLMRPNITLKNGQLLHDEEKYPPVPSEED